MIEATLADLRQSASFFKTTQVVHIVNGRKNEEVGYFVPSIFKDKFERFLIELEKEKKRQLLHRIAKSSALDTIGDGAIDDGIE